MTDQTAGSVTLLADFSAEAVLRHFNVAPDQTAIADAMRFVYRQMQDELSAPGASRAAVARAAAGVTIEKIEFTYNIFDSYADDFLKKNDEPRDALIVAALIGDHLSNANDPMAARKRNDFDDDLLDDVHILFQEAEDLCNNSDIDDEFLIHSVFLAHIRSLEFIDRVGNNMDVFSAEELQEIRDEKLPLIESFLMRKTDIGKEIKRQLKTFAPGLSQQIEILDELERMKEYEEPIEAEIISAEFPRRPPRENVESLGVTRMDSFNAVAVVDALDLKDYEIVERNAVAFMFGHVLNEQDEPTLLEEKLAAVRSTYDIAERPYRMLKEFSADYFRGEAHRQDALTLAALCDDMVHVADAEDGFDKSTLRDAEIIRDEAVNAAAGQAVSREGSFLRQAFGIMQIADGLSDLPNFEQPGDLRELHSLSHRLRRVVEPDTRIGQELQACLDATYNTLAKVPDDTMRQNFRIALPANDLS